MGGTIVKMKSRLQPLPVPPPQLGGIWESIAKATGATELTASIKRSVDKIGGALPFILGGIALGATSAIALKGKKYQKYGYYGSVALTGFGVFQLIAKGAVAKSKSVIQNTFLTGSLPMVPPTSKANLAILKARKEIDAYDTGKPWFAIKGIHELSVDVRNLSKTTRQTVVMCLYKANTDAASKLPLKPGIELISDHTHDLKPGYDTTWTTKIPSATIEEWKSQPGKIKMRFIIFSALDTKKLYPIAVSTMILLEK